MFENNQNNQNNQNNGFQNPYDQQIPDYNNFYDDPSAQNGGSNYANFYADPAGGSPKKSGGAGRTLLKVVAGLAAVAIVSVSSVEMYKLFGQDNAKNWTADAESEAAASSTDTDSTTDSGNDSESTKATAAAASNWISSAAREDALTIPQIVEKAMPSVVGISSVFEYTPSNSFNNWGFDFYNFYGGGGGNQQQQTSQFTATGSGIVMTEDGYVITNAHCIYDDESEVKAGKAVSVSVVMGDENETEYEAQIVGYDLQTDLAVLKIDATGLTPAEFGDSNELEVGELVVAIGNPLGFELFGTTTCGIVSALNREVTINEKDMTLIQTDVAINNGNSGGPLLNSYGQVVGINSAKMGSTYGSTSVEGLSFAIPITDAKDIINDLINYGYVAGRPQLGITGVNVSEADAERFNLPQGVYVYSVGEGSAAEQAGIQPSDVIVSIEGTDITSMDELNSIKNEHNAGDTVTIGLYRSGQKLEVQLTLQETRQED